MVTQAQQVLAPTAIAGSQMTIRPNHWCQLHPHPNWIHCSYFPACPPAKEITVQQLMAHLDSIRKDMVILEKSEFANLRAENEKMQIELDEVKQQLMHETSRIRADNKLDINLERSRVTDMFTDQEKQLMEATTEFTRKDTQTKSVISEISNKIDTEIASLKTLMESNKLETIRYLAASVFTCLAISLGFYRIWKYY
ncbi:coiled-coil domain-containing protein 90B, mitochondrial isoform X5 [Lepus europaeus]|nr:coiled-coil domain-containing protein 90B, mitochondrial isoform X5 [Lepus europaeus]